MGVTERDLVERSSRRGRGREPEGTFYAVLHPISQVLLLFFGTLSRKARGSPFGKSKRGGAVSFETPQREEIQKLGLRLASLRVADWQAGGRGGAGMFFRCRVFNNGD